MLFELYLMDLTPDKRKEFLEAHGVWDVDVENSSTFPNDWDIAPIMVFDTDDVDFGLEVIEDGLDIMEMMKESEGL